MGLKEESPPKTMGLRKKGESLFSLLGRSRRINAVGFFE